MEAVLDYLKTVFEQNCYYVKNKLHQIDLTLFRCCQMYLDRVAVHFVADNDAVPIVHFERERS